MDQQTVSNLLAAYRAAPSKDLEQQRLVLADALEEADDWRADELRNLKVYRPDIPRGLLRKGDTTYWVDGQFYRGQFRSRRSAEKAIRAHVLELFTVTGSLRRYAVADPSQLHAIRMGLVQELARVGDKRAHKLGRWRVVQEDIAVCTVADGEAYEKAIADARDKSSHDQLTAILSLQNNGRKTVWHAKTTSGQGLRQDFDTAEQAEEAIRRYSRGLFLEMWPDDDFKQQVIEQSWQGREWLEAMMRPVTERESLTEQRQAVFDRRETLGP